MCSFGTNTQVKLPGPSADKPNVYAFGTSYNQMHSDLKSKDGYVYMQNGLLNMLDRNRKIKEAPERFQEAKKEFDVIFTCEERCFDIVCEGRQARQMFIVCVDLLGKTSTEYNGEKKFVYVVNFDIKDNHEEATIGSRAILYMAQAMESLLKNENTPFRDFNSIIQHCQEKFPTFSIMHSVFFY